MKLLTKAIEKKLPALRSTANIPAEEKLVVAKFFHPFSTATWFAVEYDPASRTFFGYAKIQEGEWGHFSLDELESAKIRGIGVERDLWFKPTQFKNIEESL